MTTHKIDIDVTFSSPEAASLAFGILHHAAAAIAEGCRKQLVAGMASEDDAAAFLERLLWEVGPREAIIALTTRLMRETLAELAAGLTVESGPSVERTPAQVVQDGIRYKMRAAPPLDVIEAWTDEQREEVAGWLLDNRERDGFDASTMPFVLRVALASGEWLDAQHGPVDTNAASEETYAHVVGLARQRLAQERDDQSALLDKLNLEAVWTDGKLTYRSRTAGVSDAFVFDGSTVSEEVMGFPHTGDGPLFVSSGAVNLSSCKASAGHYLRTTIDGEERRCREVIVHELVKGDIVSIDDFTALCMFGNEPDSIEFYADGEDAEVDRVTLRIEPAKTSDEDRAEFERVMHELDEDAVDDGPDFSVETNGEYHDGFHSLAAMARTFPTCAPTLAAWQAGHTLPFRAVLKRARELAGLTEPLPEELEPSPSEEEDEVVT